MHESDLALIVCDLHNGLRDIDVGAWIKRSGTRVDVACLSSFVSVTG